MTDLKVYAINAFSLVVSFTAIENSLKIILLLASIIYTMQRIYQGHKNSSEKNK